MAKFIVVPILPALLKVDNIVDEIEGQMEKEAEKVYKLYKQIVRTWNHNVPFIIEKTNYDRNSIALNVHPNTSVKGGEIFNYLDYGTNVRHAVMTPGFRPKTRVRRLGSFGGSGGVARVSRNIKQPGIKPREYTEEIADRRKSAFNFNMRRAINRGIRRAF